MQTQVPTLRRWIESAVYALLVIVIGCGTDESSLEKSPQSSDANVSQSDEVAPVDSRAADSPTVTSPNSPVVSREAEAPKAGAAIAAFGFSDGSEIRDIAMFPDGSCVACGVLKDAAAPPEDIASQNLLDGNHDSGIRPFVMKLSRGIDQLEWFSVLPAGTIDPKCIVALEDGGVGIGGKHLGGLEVLDKTG